MQINYTVNAVRERLPYSLPGQPTMKLIRDRISGLPPGSTRRADHDEKEILLRAKLVEEAAEVGASTSRETMVEEFGDLYEVILTLAGMNGIEFTEIIVAARKTRVEKGGFADGVILLHDPELDKKKLRGERNRWW